MHVSLMGTARLAAVHETLELSSLTSGQARLVFAYLAVEAPRAVRSDELADCLWPDRLPKSWQATLRGVVARVRRWLDEVGLDPLSTVQATNGGYRLRLPDDWSVDVHEASAALSAAESLARSGDHAATASAAGRARELTSLDFLPEQDGEWTNETRRWIHDMHLRALEIEADARAGAGDHRAALSAVRRLVAVEPLSETARQQLMELLVAGGDRSGALAVYDEFVSVLNVELGVNPSVATQAMRVALLNDDSDSRRPRRDRFVRQHSASRFFVGRTAELDRLDEAWQRARSGESAVFVIAGESGIGKTSLAVQAASRYFNEGATVLFGRCAQNPVLPFEPFVEAIEFHLEGCSAAERDRLLEIAGAELSWAVPSLTAMVPALDVPPITDQDRRRLFDAVSKYVRGLTDDGPTVLIIDDVQWATETTLLMLGHVVHRLRNSPMLVLLLERRRPEATSEGHLGVSLAALSRDPGLDELVLEGLGAADTEILVRVAAGIDDQGPLGGGVRAEQLRSRCGGNPFFMVELLRADRDLRGGYNPGRALPRGITDIVEHRCSAVGLNGTAVLQALAVIGSSGGGQLLQHVSGLDDDDFLDAVDEARSTGLIRQISDHPGHFAFSHALAEESIYALIPLARSARLHRRVGEGLESLRVRGAEVSAGELARHFTLARTMGVADRAIGYTLEAARADLAAGAREDAIARLRSALAETPHPRLRCEIMLLLGTAYQEQGDGLQARQSFLEAARLAGDVGDGNALAEAALGVNVGGRGVSSWEADPVRIALLELALAEKAPDSPALRIRLMAAVSETLRSIDEWPRRQRLADQAMAIAAGSSSTEVIVSALEASRVAWWRPNQAHERLEYADRVLDLVGDRKNSIALQAMLLRLADLVILGDRSAVDAARAAIRPIARALGQVRYLWELQLWEVGFAINDGRLAEADALARQAAALWDSDDQPDAQRALREQIGMIMLLVGDASLVVAGLEQPPDLLGSAAATYRCVLPYALALEGRDDEASSLLERHAALEYRDLPQHSSWLFAAVILSEAAAVTGTTNSVEQLRRMLHPHAGLMVLLQGPQVIWGCVDHHLGSLAARVGDQDRGLHHLRRALAQHRGFGSRLWEAKTMLTLGRLLLTTPTAAAREEGIALLVDAAEIADTAGLDRLASQARSLARLP